MRLNNKVVIITGAAHGIGEQFAIGMAREGAKVVVADVADGSQVVERINEIGGVAQYVHCDVSEKDSCEAMVRTTNETFGGVHVLIANAALFSQIEPQSLMDITVEEWDKVMAVNVRGVWLSVCSVVPYMQEQGGSIINIATNRILTGIPEMLHYDASKGAVSAMTRVMAMELGRHDIRVNAIAPGLTMTERVSQRDGIHDRNEEIVARKPLNRTQSPEDLVGTAIFLATDDSAQITGQTIVVDGGSIMR